MQAIGISRPMASKYLNRLVAGDFLEKYKLGRHYYVNRPLYDLFAR